MKLRLSTLAVFALFFVSVPLQAQAESGHKQMIVDTFAEGVSGSSEVFALPDSEVQKIINNVETNYLAVQQRCDAIDKAPCAGKTGLSFRIYLPVCTSSITDYCIAGLSMASKSDAPMQQAQFIDYSGGRLFAADPARGFPGASATSRWKANGVSNAGGTDTYAVKVLIDGFLSSTSKSVYVFEASAVVEGFKDLTIPKQADGQPGNDSRCDSWQGDGICGQHVSLNEGQHIKLSIHLPNSVTGWLHGRLKNQTVNVTKVNERQNELTVEADSVLIPELNTVLTDAQFNSLPNPSYFISNGQNWDSVNGGNTAALEWIKQLSGVLKDTATGEHASWSFSTAPGNSNTGDCFGDKTQVIGLVTTNALAYSPGAPVFDGKQLNYQVAGLHFRPGGTAPNIGTYDLSIRSATARCLYQFTNAPLSATVSVTDGQGGEKQIATTVLTEKDGWLHLGAYGFTFSSPVLHVKFTQASTTSTNKNSPTVAGKTNGYSLTCVKGKQVQKIIAAKPICPTGWKKK